MQMYEQPHLTEKEKTAGSLSEMAYNASKLRDILEGLRNLMMDDLLTTQECQSKADIAINSFISYCHKGGE